MTVPRRDTTGRMRLSQVLPSRAIAVVTCLASAIYLLILPEWNPWLSVIPFILMATKGVDLSVSSGLFLSGIWMTYTLALTSPLYFLLGRYTLLLIYLPIVGVVFYKKPHEEATPLFLTLETVFWDVPLLLWVRVVSRCGGRALAPFYSPIPGIGPSCTLTVNSRMRIHNCTKPADKGIANMRHSSAPSAEGEELSSGTRSKSSATSQGQGNKHIASSAAAKASVTSLRLAVGSLPLEVDVPWLRDQCGVQLVVNMCREYTGPVAAYTAHGIRQLHLPTPDICEPSLRDIVRAVQTVKKAFSSSSGSSSSNNNSSDKRSREQGLQQQQKKTQRASDGAVFVHCKAGRGRAATCAICIIYTLCICDPTDDTDDLDDLDSRSCARDVYNMNKNKMTGRYSKHEPVGFTDESWPEVSKSRARRRLAAAAALLVAGRHVVEVRVARAKVVERYVWLLEHVHGGDFDALLADVLSPQLGQ